MRCKPGDLAVICGPTAEPVNVGIFLRVTKCDPLDSTWQFNEATRPIQFYQGSDPIGRFSSSSEAGGNAWIFDNDLRPIRDQPGEDETLTWAPVPSTVEV